MTFTLLPLLVSLVLPPTLPLDPSLLPQSCIFLNIQRGHLLDYTKVQLVI